MTNEELLAKATCFELLSYDPTDVSAVGMIRGLKVELRTRVTDPDQLWAITSTYNECLNHKNDWEYEPNPSSRTEAFLKRCRWKTRNEAVEFAIAHMAKYPLGYKPGRTKAEKERYEEALRIRETMKGVP